MELAASMYKNLTVGGRLGSYRYYDMDQVIGMAMKDAKAFQ
jgi:UDP-galactopyranose mutase